MHVKHVWHMVSPRKMLALVKWELVLPHIILPTTLLNRSSGHFIDEVAGAQGVKCIAHSTELLNGKLNQTQDPGIEGCHLYP